ncbi:DUF4897 domain-containing protein [Natrinema halophilum]|uniref:DUF4897 domain-containing protein n=1 Tax=Natrinema halophilum TaxID=1699371 RepID=A0A7D5KET0_9EURY|nr:DUF4897 domain-containing protein [Natrinema halophilum]QLG50476.1 DUF4897 domain-containing protein [Natrinema halophilum]
MIALLVTVSVTAPAGAKANQTSEAVAAEPAFGVALEADGSAHVTLATTFNLTTDGERQAFQALRQNETAREQRTERFAARMRAIATRAENETGRAMQITDAGISFRERNDTGVVTLSVTWDGLAAQQGDRLVLKEPFDSEFSLDRPFRVTRPDGYELASVSPEPTERSQNDAVWSGGTDFDGFEATFAPSNGEAGADDGLGGSVPGFSVGTAVLAVLAGVGLLMYRDRCRR